MDVSRPTDCVSDDADPPQVVGRSMNGSSAAALGMNERDIVAFSSACLAG